MAADTQNAILGERRAEVFQLVLGWDYYRTCKMSGRLDSNCIRGYERRVSLGIFSRVSLIGVRGLQKDPQENPAE